ncbi:MAG: substrate-binding domain-containing protein [Clostridiales bacterium]|nr:substrate-binding domain-containing protein [Clostridiales bacterium]
MTRVFNPNWAMNVRPEIREKVLAAAEALNYTPNAFARMLAGNRTNLIAIVLGPATGPYYSQTLLHFIYKLQQKGKQVLPFTMDGDRDYRALLEHIKPFRVDAIILTSAASSAVYEPSGTDIPVILLEHKINGAPVHSVSSDTYAGGKAVADMLVENGHRKIAFISGNGTMTQDFGRDYGFVSRMHDHGLTVWRTEMASYARYASGCVATRRLMIGREYPDAIFCADDVLAMSAIDVLRDEFGVLVPQGISVVGFHNIHEAALPPYALTTMQSPMDDMTDAVIDIIDCLDRAEEPMSSVFAMKPIVRNSMRITDPKYAEMRESRRSMEMDDLLLNIMYR